MRVTRDGRLYDYGDIIRLPENARMIVVSDIHGNYEDFCKYIKLWKKGGKDTHIIFLGDLIHGLDPETDRSIDILLKILDFISDDTFHVLMGNHEWYQIHDYPIYKNEINQTMEFRDACKKRGTSRIPIISLCKAIIKEFKKIAIAPNGLVMAHAGPHKNMNNILEDMNGLTLSPIYEQEDIDDAFEKMVFARPNDPLGYTEKDIDDFLAAVNGNTMIVGHTPVGGYYVFGNQVIMDSSFETDTKYYLSMSTSEDCYSTHDIIKNLVELD